MPNDRHTHVFFISGRGAEAAVVRDTPEVEWGRLPLSAQRWARYLGAAAMFHLGDSAPTQPHFLYLHAHLYLTTAGRWLKSSVLQCSNSLCKIESWLWADVNHNNLACTFMLLEGALRRIWMQFVGCQGVDCFSDGQADTQRDGHRQETTQTERDVWCIKWSLYSPLHIQFCLSPRRSWNFLLAIPQPLYYTFLYSYFHCICCLHFFGNVRNPLLFQ